MARFKKTLSNWLNARHILIIQNEENFSEKATYKFTYAKIIFFAFLSFLVVFALSFYLVNTILDQWFDPRYAERQTRQELVELTFELDSLSFELESRDQFIQSIKKVLQGDVTTNEIPESAEASGQEETDYDQIAKTDSIFKSEFESGSGGDFLLSSSMDNLELRNTYFFPPLTGFVVATFDPQEGHFGIDIVSKKDEPVKSIADGTVVFTGWTQDDGNIIAVQHRENLISIYKHNSAVMKAVGDVISAGDIIAIIGNTGELTSGPHLHIELWFNGSPVNPQEFITF
ncbi:M23 family metallopeptidase [Roseivirga sp.]|uniref:M23 family metallopeptidase n=1 Tax=Roseivirga sp. TaxID=1964215 RepID=UPI0023561829|nr:M23 family metallopeptidase [Roseivirga sp.]